MNFFKIIAIGLLLLLVGGVYMVVERPMPQLSGTLYVEGLKDRVEIIRDRWGVPHIYAQNEEDLFFAQGYVTAQDRLWQMDLNRRAGHGRLSEIFGRAALRADKTVRTLGLHRFAEASAQNLSPWARRIVEAYARGVNAFISAHRDRLPLEFMILGYKPEPWTVEDTIAVFAPLAQILQSTMYDQIRRARARMVLGEEKLKELDADYSTEGTFLIDADGRGTIASQSKALQPSMLPTLQLQSQTLEALEAFAADYAGVARLAPDALEVLGSNNWVVHGALTDTGKPYLANDPHLEPQQPGHFYEIHLNGPGWNVIGVSVPGIPGVTLGHNGRIAWGATAAVLAVQDLFVERFNPNNPRQYEYQGRWEEAQVVREEIRVRGERDPVIHEVLITRHGPVVTELFRDHPERVALSWALLLAKDASLDGLLMLNRARNWEEFRRAVSQWGLDLNFVYADIEGNIGYQLSGRVPRRPKGYTGVPAPGWTGEYDWDGFIPFEQLPHALNPKTRFVATANHRTVAKEYQPEIPGEWQAPFRARRIVQLLRSKERFTLEDMRAMQADSYSEPHHQLAQLLVAHVHPASKREQQALDYLKAWDGVIREENVAPSIIREAFGELIDRTFRHKLGRAASFIGPDEIYLFLKLAQEDPSSEWFDDPATAEREELDDILTIGFQAALEDLTKAHGAEMSRWQWGKIVAKRKFQHPLSGVPLVGAIFDRSASCSCGGYSINVGHNAAWRALIDLADLDNSRSGLPTGQAGHPFSKHYSDQLPAWRMVQPHPMLWERASIERHQEAVLILLPKQVISSR